MGGILAGIFKVVLKDAVRKKCWTETMESEPEIQFDGRIEFDIAGLKDIIRKDDAPGPPEGNFYKPACVFLLLFDLKDPHVLAIQKADSEGYFWRNQVALPGGHLDIEDASPLEGAFRELEEELSIRRDQINLIGSIGHYQTINRRDIQVFVGVWNAAGPVRSDPTEISRILKIPLRVLVQTHLSNNYHNRIPDIEELKYFFEDLVIWGATARIFHHLIEIFYPLFGNVAPDQAYGGRDKQATA
jgi:8-oxo-dGTP pyrophosphatase MutT (NUDIX family)